MAKWITLTRDHDYWHASRAVTAYKAGMRCHVPDKIARDIVVKGAAEYYTKPDDSELTHG